MARSYEYETDPATGLLVAKEKDTRTKIVKEEKMTRQVWRCWFEQEEITEQEFRDEYARTNRPLDM